MSKLQIETPTLKFRAFLYRAVPNAAVASQLATATLNKPPMLSARIMQGAAPSKALGLHSAGPALTTGHNVNLNTTTRRLNPNLATIPSKIFGKALPRPLHLLALYHIVNNKALSPDLPHLHRAKYSSHHLSQRLANPSSTLPETVQILTCWSPQCFMPMIFVTIPSIKWQSLNTRCLPRPQALPQVRLITALNMAVFTLHFHRYFRLHSKNNRRDLSHSIKLRGLTVILRLRCRS